MYKNGKRKLDAKSGDNGVTAKISKRVAVVADRSYAWATGLKSTIDDSNLHIYSDDKLVVIKDKYPKAKHHFLVLPRESFATLKSLKVEHVALLKHMDVIGREIAEKTGCQTAFRYGYHAIPSMSHVHLHVISEDFDSPCLKTKKHWNSFTTDYFIKSKEVMRILEETGKLSFDTQTYTQLLKENLRCHVCQQEYTTMPALKKHIIGHFS